MPLGCQPITADAPVLEVPAAPPMMAARAPAAPAPVLCPAQTELQHGLPHAAFVYAHGLGGDQGLVVEVVEQRGLDQLGEEQRPLHGGDGHVRMHHAPLGDAAQGQTGRNRLAFDVVKKLGCEQGAAVGAFQVAQIINLGVLEVGFGNPIHEGFQSGVDAVAGLVDAVIGVGTEEIIELGSRLMDAHTVINLRHGELVKVGEEHTLGK